MGPRSSNPAAVKADLEKLAYLRRLDAHTMDLSMLPAERRRFGAGVGRRLTGQALQRREPERRYPILLTLLAQSALDVLDEANFALFDLVGQQLPPPDRGDWVIDQWHLPPPVRDIHKPSGRGGGRCINGDLSDAELLPGYPRLRRAKTPQPRYSRR